MNSNNNIEYYDNNLYVGTVSKYYNKNDFIKKIVQMTVNKNNINPKIALECLDYVINNEQKLYNVVLRKILFIKEGEYAKDLLHDLPKYEIVDSNDILDENKLENNIVVNNVINIKNLLENFEYGKIITSNEVKSIYNFFLKPKSRLFKFDYPSLPINFEDLIKLKEISYLTGNPDKKEFKNIDLHNKKVKVYTFK